MPDREPGKQPLQIEDEQRRVNRHVEHRRHQRQPRFLESPKISHRPPDPGVVPALFRQRARKLADHERGRQTPQNWCQQQNQNGPAIPGAVHDVLRAVRAARYHKEGSGDQGPQGEPAEFFVLGNNRELLGWLGRCASCCQFLWLPPQATHSHHRVSLEFSRLPGNCDSTGISAKLVRSTENTAN